MNPRTWWRIGWRNLGRNRRRTLITASGLAFGYLAVVVQGGLFEGMVAEMIESGTGVLAGQLQVHAPDYLPDRSVYATLGGRQGIDVSGAVRRVTEAQAVSAASARVFGSALVSSGKSTVAGLLLGVEPEREVRVSRFLSTVERGRSPRAGAREIVIGDEMARQLALRPGDEAVVVAPAADGSMGNDLFTIVGIFHTGISEMDRSYAIAPLASVQELLVLPPGRVHEIAAHVDQPWLAVQAASEVAATLRAASIDADVQPWTEFEPEMADFAQMARGWQGFLIVVIFGLAVFGVANTMLMATFERRREFAVLLALGAGPRVVVGSVFAEALALAVISLCAGVAVTLPLMAWWHVAPPDVSWLYGGYTIGTGLIRPILRVEYPEWLIVAAGVALFLTAVVASLLPAARAARLPPAEVLGGR